MSNNKTFKTFKALVVQETSDGEFKKSIQGNMFDFFTYINQ